MGQKTRHLRINTAPAPAHGNHRDLFAAYAADDAQAVAECVRATLVRRYCKAHMPTLDDNECAAIVEADGRRRVGECAPNVGDQVERRLEALGLLDPATGHTTFELGDDAEQLLDNGTYQRALASARRERLRKLRAR